MRSARDSRTGRAPRALAAAALCFALASCERRGPGLHAGSVAQLEWNLAAAHRIEVVVLDPALVAAARTGARTLAARTGFDVELFEPGREPSGRGARILIGGFEAAPVAELLDALGVRQTEARSTETGGDEQDAESERALEPPLGEALEDEGPEGASADRVAEDEPAAAGDAPASQRGRERAARRAAQPRYLGVPIGGAGSVIAACFEDPRRPGLPVALIAGNAPGSVRPLLEDLRFPRRPAARVWAAGFEALELWLEPDGSPRGSSVRDRAASRRLERHGQAKVPTGDALLAARRSRGVGAERARAYCAASLRARDALVAWAGAGASAPPLALALVSEPAEMLAISGRVALATPAGLGSAAFAMLCDGLPDDGGAALARECALSLLGPPAEVWMADGAAVDAAGSWWGRALAREAGGPARSIPPIATLVDPAALDRESMHVLAPARALLFRFLRERLGGDALRAAWKGERALPPLEPLEDEFRAWAQPLQPGERAPMRPFAPPGGFLRGLAIDSEVRAGGELASADLQRAFSNAVRAGATALSFTSYGCVRAPDPSAPGGRLEAGLESIEGDAALAAGIALARKKGVRSVLLQPKLLAHEGGDEWAQRPRTTVEDWDEFFAGYEPWLAHYAALAELTGCELYCIGTEVLPRSNDARELPDVHEHAARLWSHAIEAARALYGGALTYAARFPLEVQGAPFWDELDAVGYTFYPELAGALEPSGAPASDKILETQLRGHLDDLGAFAAQHGKPALLVETGFRATRRSAFEPELGGSRADADEQARVYRAFGKALASARETTGAFAGVFVWNWDVDPLARDGESRGFSARGKPAEEALRFVFRRGQ